jgi:hypothetical protein
MAKKMETWAMYGPPTGGTWNPRKDENEKYPEIKPLVANPWTILGTTAPQPGAGHEAPTVAGVAPEPKAKGKRGGGGTNTAPAWHGTLLPQSDGDIWLAMAFADYERLVATEHAALRRGDTPEVARAKLDQSVADLRNSVANNKLDVSLADLKLSTTSDDWYNLAANKGVLLLHELRTQVGAALFDKAMDEFGMRFGGQRVSSRQFRAHFEQATGRSLDGFFAVWLREKGLPGVKAEGK